MAFSSLGLSRTVVLTRVLPEATVLTDAVEAAVFVWASVPGPAVFEGVVKVGLSLILEVTVVMEPRPFDLTTGSSSLLSSIKRSIGIGYDDQLQTLTLT